MRKPLLVVIVPLLLAVAVAPSPARSQQTTVFDNAPPAHWIAHPEAPGDEFGVFHFRRVFDLDSVPDSFLVHVSADNRYRLYLNGAEISSGPQRSDLMHWRYESVELAPQLQAGRNVLAALVWNWGAARPVAQFSHRTAFLLQGNSLEASIVNSGPAWKVFRNPGYAPLPVRGSDVGGYYASPPGEAFDAGLHPWGWTDAAFEDGAWTSPAAVADASWAEASATLVDDDGGWQLTARSIPPMEESTIRFASVRRAEAIQVNDAFLRGEGDLRIPPATRAVLLLDQAYLTNAYTVLETSGGAGSTVTLIYAEALKDAQGNKGSRNECARETYFDTPYYEQLQYVGDTRIQVLITLYMTHDDRLVRQALEHFDLSRIPEGITASRYPSALEQYIPTFSLIWIAMVHDYWMHRDDPAYVRDFLPGIRGVLAWFEQRIDASGLLGAIPEWPYVDWARGWPRGMPPGATEGQSTVISLQFAYALERAADLEAALGNPANAADYRDRASSLKVAVRESAWDAARNLFRDTPDGLSFSQHANVLAILTNTVSEDDKAGLMERLLADASLTQSTYYFSYYLLEALRDAGLGDRYIEQLEPWQEMLALGLTTVPETPEPTRSDSHAWSAHPNYGLLATVLGVRPAEPGFRSVRITPQLGELQRAEGTVPHPLGDIELRLIRSVDGGLRATESLPAGLDGVLEWQGEEIVLMPGGQNLEL